MKSFYFESSTYPKNSNGRKFMKIYWSQETLKLKVTTKMIENKMLTQQLTVRIWFFSSTSIIWWMETPKVTSMGSEEFFTGLTVDS